MSTKKTLFMFFATFLFAVVVFERRLMSRLYPKVSPICRNHENCLDYLTETETKTKTETETETETERETRTGGTEKSHTKTGTEHLLFAIASSNATWHRRGPYVRTWWDNRNLRGHVWFDSLPSNRLSTDPEFKLSNGINEVQYNGHGHRYSLRFAQMVVDSFRMNLPNVRWYVKGDDDTFFNPQGIAAILSKYDHEKMLYIGSQSESHSQNAFFSHDMAFGGGGFAISTPLAAALNGTLNGCMERHADLWGSDGRVQRCIAELGVHITRERGFHQCDIHGSIGGLLESHFLEVFASLHHVARLNVFLPKTKNRIEALDVLSKAMKPDPVGFLQHSICYDQKGKWTASIAWGYSVKIYPNIVKILELEKIEQTFKAFNGATGLTAFDFDTREIWPMAPINKTCDLPFAFYINNVYTTNNGEVVSVYTRHDEVLNRTISKHCDIEITNIFELRVIRGKLMEVTIGKNGRTKGPNLKRECCQKIKFEEEKKDYHIGTIWLGGCESGLFRTRV